MNTRTLLLLLVLVYVATCLVLPKKKFARKLIHGRPKGGFVPKLNHNGPKAKVSGDQFIAMKVDHFDSSNTQTYQKRYWYNNQWYKAGGPVFLYINGESTGDSSWIQGGSILSELAQQLNAFVFATEHRYYGDSKVPNQASNMQYLSSRQELADLADFVPAMNTLFNFSQDAKWVTFGGSYAGGLTALSRVAYPNVFYGALGSSGVVNALVDYVGYLNVVQDVLMTYTNNQTQQNCGQNLKDGLTLIRSLMTSATGRQQLFKGFTLCQPLDPNNAQLMGNFYSTVLDNFMGEVQYGEYEGVCATVTNPIYGNDSLSRLEYVVTGGGQGGCIDIDYNTYIQEVKDDPDYFNWLYQTCSEFGWYQTTDGAKNIAFYGNDVPVSWYVPECSALYGSNFGNASVYANIDSTNKYYGGSAGYNGTRVVLPNGLADPWHVVGVLNATNSQQTIVLIPGGSHCEDMYGDAPNDSADMKAAKTKIKNAVLSWFNS